MANKPEIGSAATAQTEAAEAAAERVVKTQRIAPLHGRSGLERDRGGERPDHKSKNGGRVTAHRIREIAPLLAYQTPAGLS
jgi:hypothetical protein